MSMDAVGVALFIRAGWHFYNKIRTRNGSEVIPPRKGFVFAEFPTGCGMLTLATWLN